MTIKKADTDKFLYFDASAGLSGDMILGALLDLGVSKTHFLKTMAGLGLPVNIKIRETKRSSLRGLKVDVFVDPESPKRERTWKDVRTLIGSSSLPEDVKDDSLSIFESLFRAEAHVHGLPFDKTHLHEAGADDAIIDIVGCCFLVKTLGIDVFYASPLNVGRGWVKTSHGRLPVPPPAVAELLKDIPVYSAWSEHELVTPTGAAIVSTLVQKFQAFPEMNYMKIGYGAGSRDLPEIPNLLRVFFGKKERFSPDKKVYIIEANIDDSPPQILAAYVEKALKLGALDVTLTPTVMKKNRLATTLRILSEARRLDALIRSVFEETSTIGIRYYAVERRVLDRKWSKVKVQNEDITVKTSFLEGEEINALPEFEDCLKAAKKTGLPLKKIDEMARAQIVRDRESKKT